MKYLAIQSSDWCDEFTAECFRIFDDELHAQQYVDALVENGGYFGTNEGWEENELYHGDFKIKEISDDEALVLERLLGVTFGTGLL